MIKIKQLFFFIILGIDVYCRSPSKASNNKFILNLINDLDYTVELYWVDYDGNMDNNPVILPPQNTSFPLSSFYNHRWVISTQKEEYKEILLGFGEFNKSNQEMKISRLLHGETKSDTILITTTASTTETTTDTTTETMTDTATIITSYTTTNTSTPADTSIVTDPDLNRTKNSVETVAPVKLEINWELKKNWAMFCEFTGKDFESEVTAAQSCKITCQFTEHCSHYTWNTTNGGTCWMKRGSVEKSDATYKNDVNSICGVIEKSMWKASNWARKCEFKGNNLTHVTNVKSDSDCAMQCTFISNCTHFTWSEHNNGTCWMKKGLVWRSNATESEEESTICGIVKSTNATTSTTTTTSSTTAAALPRDIETTTVPFYETTTATKVGVEKMKDYIMYQFIEKFFLYLSGPIFISLFAFFGFLMNKLTQKINDAKEKKGNVEPTMEKKEERREGCQNCDKCKSQC